MVAASLILIEMSRVAAADSKILTLAASRYGSTVSASTVMTTPEALMRAYYSARAPEYDSIYLRPERQADLRAVESWLAPRFAAEPVLEIACGTGYWTSFIASSAARIVALDFRPGNPAHRRGRISATTVQSWLATPTHCRRTSASLTRLCRILVLACSESAEENFLRGVTRC